MCLNIMLIVIIFIYVNFKIYFLICKRIVFDKKNESFYFYGFVIFLCYNKGNFFFRIMKRKFGSL